MIELRPSSASSVSNSLWQRYTKANNNNVDMCISIHANAGGGIGTEVFTYKGKEVKEARNVLNNIVSLGFNNRGIKDGSNLAMIRNTSSVSMLIEICFVDTQSDVDLYHNVGPEKIATAIVSGLTGQTVSTDNKKYYIVTNYIKEQGYCGDGTFEGIDLQWVQSYFNGKRLYVKHDGNGIWFETELMSKKEVNEIKQKIGSWFYSVK